MSNIPFSKEEIKEMLKLRLTGSHKDLLSEAIVELLNNHTKLTLLVKASLGLKPVLSHRLYEEYLVCVGMTTGYDRDVIETKKAGFITADDQQICKLISFNPWDEYSCVIEYYYIDNTGKKITKTDTVSMDHLKLKEEFPEGF